MTEIREVFVEFKKDTEDSDTDLLRPWRRYGYTFVISKREAEEILESGVPRLVEFKMSVNY